MKIMIDGERWDVDDVFTGGYLPLISCGAVEFYLAESEEEAGKAARKYWEEMAESDPKELPASSEKKR